MTLLGRYLSRVSLVLSLAVLLSPIPEARAYSEMIRLGYVQCKACHVNSLGAGLLSPYGKSVRTSLALYRRADENPSENWINANAFARYLWIRSDTRHDNFLMQLDASARAEKNGWSSLITLGMVPERVRNRANAPEGVLGRSFLLRQFYVERRLNDRIRILAGRDFFPRGINSDDHTGYLRSLSRQGVTDYPSQIRGEFTTDSHEIIVGAFGPSGEENAQAREWGGYARSEWKLFDLLSAGINSSYGKSKTMGRFSTDLFARGALNENWGILGAFQWTHRSVSTGSSFLQAVTYLEPFYQPIESLTIRYRYEAYHIGEPFKSDGERHGVGFQFKPISETSLIASMERTRSAHTWGETTYVVQVFAQL